LSVTLDLDGYFKKAGNVHLATCSSADGQNFYFPIVGDNNNYRQSTVNDRNVNYIGFIWISATTDSTIVLIETRPRKLSLFSVFLPCNGLTNFVLKSKSDTKTIRIDQNVIFNRSMNIAMEISNDDVAHRTN